MKIASEITKAVGRSLGLTIQNQPTNHYYYPEQYWGDGVTEEGGQRKGVYTDAFWLAPPFGRPRDIDYQRLEPLEKSVWVRMCVQHIVDSIAGASWSIGPTIHGDDVDEKLMDEAREFFQGAKWANGLSHVLRECLPELANYDCGAINLVFPVKAFNNKGDLKGNIAPVELVALDGRSILKDVGLFKNLRGYWQYSWINPRGLPVHFEPEEIIYLQQAPSSREPYGISNLEVIQEVLDYMMDSTLAQSKYWKNGLFIGGQIDLPEVTDINELKRMQAYYEAKLRGPRKYNKWIITGGGAKVQSMPFTSQQMQWLDSQKWFAKMVFAIYKLTPSELGFTEDLNRATGIQQMQIHKSKGIRPILQILEEAFNRTIVWKHFSPKIKFSFDYELDLDDEIKQTTIDTQRLAAGLDSVNELRDRDGKDKWEDKKYDGPNADQQQPEAEDPWAGLFGGDDGAEPEDGLASAEPPEDDDAFAEKVARKILDITKAANAGAASGEPGYVPAPPVYDGPGKPLRLQQDEEAMKEAVNRFLKEMNEGYRNSTMTLFHTEGN